jgi:excisionase family DNA binding protein
MSPRVRLAELGDVLSVATTSKVLGISKNATYAAIARGELPAVKVGHRILVPRVRLEALLNNGDRDHVIDGDDDE